MLRGMSVIVLAERTVVANCRKWIGAVVPLLGVLASPGVVAQYYLGVEAGREHLSFRPEYSPVHGGPNDRYDNRANGSVAGVVGGYRWQGRADFSLGVEGRLSVSDTDWKLTLPEPARFRYDVPVSAAMALLPTYRVTENFSVFAETGLALGKIRLRKATTNAVRSRYDVSTWRPGIVAGVGMRYAIGGGWSVRAGYRRTWYKEHDFNTYRADGSQVEAVSSKVVQSMTTLGLMREF